MNVKIKYVLITFLYYIIVWKYRIYGRIRVTRFGNLLDSGQLFKPLATFNVPKSPTFLANISKGVKIYHI